MTVLPAPRRVVDGGPRTAPKKFSRSGGRSVSVSRENHDAIAAAAEKHGCAKADVVRTALAPVLDPNTPPEVLATIVERARRDR